MILAFPYWNNPNYWVDAWNRVIFNRNLPGDCWITGNIFIHSENGHLSWGYIWD